MRDVGGTAESGLEQWRNEWLHGHRVIESGCDSNLRRISFLEIAHRSGMDGCDKLIERAE